MTSPQIEAAGTVRPVLQPLSICLPLTMAVMLIVSGIAKLRRPDDLTGWAEMGVPKALRKQWLLVLHPWGEMALGVLIALLGGWVGIIAALLAVVLMGVYTVLIATVLRRSDDASCACFGERKQITRGTLARNIWLVTLALGTVGTVGGTPLFGGAVAAAVRGSAGGWLVGLVAVSVTTWLVEPSDDAASESAVPDSTATTDGNGEELDYVRTRTPAVPVTLADGTVKTLRELTTQGPVLLLSVSHTCGACEPVIEKVPEYRHLLPDVEIRLLLLAEPDQSPLTETAEPQSLHDPHGYSMQSIDGWQGTPTAVLLGADGMLAGGPVAGSGDVDEFIHQIRAELDS